MIIFVISRTWYSLNPSISTGLALLYHFFVLQLICNQPWDVFRRSTPPRFPVFYCTNRDTGMLWKLCSILTDTLTKFPYSFCYIHDFTSTHCHSANISHFLSRGNAWKVKICILFMKQSYHMPLYFLSVISLQYLSIWAENLALSVPDSISALIRLLSFSWSIFSSKTQLDPRVGQIYLKKGQFYLIINTAKIVHSPFMILIGVSKLVEGLTSWGSSLRDKVEGQVWGSGLL